MCSFAVSSLPSRVSWATLTARCSKASLRVCSWT
jgi:hypothetical protein